jgi:hypothetical protein
VALVDGEELGRGSGRSKKHAEQDAAQIALDGMVPTGRRTRTRSCSRSRRLRRES